MSNVKMTVGPLGVISSVLVITMVVSALGGAILAELWLPLVSGMFPKAYALGHFGKPSWVILGAFILPLVVGSVVKAAAFLERSRKEG